jgi:hypothetical protein
MRIVLAMCLYGKGISLEAGVLHLCDGLGKSKLLQRDRGKRLLVGLIGFE